MTNEKTFSEVISEKEKEVEDKFEQWIEGQSKLFGKRLYKNSKDVNYAEEEMGKEIKFIINSMVSSIQQHRRDVDALQNARHIN